MTVPAQVRRSQFIALLRFFARHGNPERPTGLLRYYYAVAKEIARVEGRAGWDSVQGTKE